MPINNIGGVMLGTTLVQESAVIGGSRSVFVKLQGVKNDLVFPTHGGQLQNPFAGKGKIFAGDLIEYRTDANGQNPVTYVLKTFEAAEAVTSSAKIVYIVRNGYRHVPSVGDILMVAPETLAGTGTAAKVNAVEVDGDNWKVTLNAAIGEVAKGAILVEAAEAGSGKGMLVKNPNTFAPNDMDLLYPQEGNAYEKPRYFITPALHGTAYISKMSPVPACVLALNKSAVNGWFEL